MIRFSSTKISRLILISLLLRVAVPAGLMPANLEDGWYLTICPHGISVQTMAAVFGQKHVHHSDNETEFIQCDLGSGLGTPLTEVDGGAMPSFSPAPIKSWSPRLSAIPSKPRINYQPRSPPTSRST